MSRTAVRETPIVVTVGDESRTLTLGLAQLDDSRWIFGLTDSHIERAIGWISYEWDAAEWGPRLARSAERGYFCFYSGDRHQAAIVATYGELWKALNELGLVA